MSIQKKSLISTLKTAKKAKVASAPLAQVDVELQSDKKLSTKHVKATPAIRLAKSAPSLRLSARHTKR